MTAERGRTNHARYWAARAANPQPFVREPEPSALDLIEQLADVGTSEETEGVASDCDMDEIIRLCRAYSLTVQLGDDGKVRFA